MLNNGYANEVLEKTLNTNAATTGNILIPEVVEPVIRRFIETTTPLFQFANPRPWATNVYMYRLVNDLPTATFSPDGAALPAADRANFVRKSVQMKYLYSRGSVTGPLIAAAGSLYNAYEMSIEMTGLGMAQTLEEKLIAGDSAANPNEFDGMVAQIDHTFSPEDATEELPATLTLAIMDEAIDTYYNDSIIMNKAMGRRVWSLLQAQQRFMNETEIDGGFRVITYGGRPIIRLENANVQTALNNQILFVHRQYVSLPILQDVTFEELGKTADSRDYFVKMYLALAVEGGDVSGNQHVRLINVSSTVA